MRRYLCLYILGLLFNGLLGCESGSSSHLSNSESELRRDVGPSVPGDSIPIKPREQARDAAVDILSEDSGSGANPPQYWSNAPRRFGRASFDFELVNSFKLVFLTMGIIPSVFERPLLAGSHIRLLTGTSSRDKLTHWQLFASEQDMIRGIPVPPISKKYTPSVSDPNSPVQGELSFEWEVSETATYYIVGSLFSVDNGSHSGFYQSCPGGACFQNAWESRISFSLQCLSEQCISEEMRSFRTVPAESLQTWASTMKRQSHVFWHPVTWGTSTTYVRYRSILERDVQVLSQENGKHFEIPIYGQIGWVNYKLDGTFDGFAASLYLKESSDPNLDQFYIYHIFKDAHLNTIDSALIPL